MTRDQLHINFKIAMDKNSQSVAFGACPAFLPEEIDYWLNLAVLQEVSNKYTGQNTLKQPFEQSIKRIHDLEKLVQTKKNIIATKELNTNCCYILDLFGDEKMFYVGATLNFDDKKSQIIVIQHAQVDRFKKTYNNNPWIETPVAVLENNSMYIYYDDITMNANNYSIDLTYIATPTKVENLTPLNDPFPEYMWEEIVNRAVELALENIESKRYQTKLQINQLDE